VHCHVCLLFAMQCCTIRFLNLTSRLRAIPQIGYRPSYYLLTRKMSFEATILNLRSPVKELVLSATKDGKELVGHNDVDKQEVLGWIDKTTQESFVNENNLKVCDSVCVVRDRF